MTSYFLSVKGYESSHDITTQIVSKLDLLAWLDQQPFYPKFYWKPRGDHREYAAAGSLIFFNKIPEFTLSNNSPAAFYGGMQFAHFNQDLLWESYPSCYFFIPEWEIIQDDEKTEIRHFQFKADDTPFNPQSSSLALPDKKAHFRKDTPHYQSWKDLTEKALVSIQNQEFQKVVLARRTSFHMVCNPYALLQQLKNTMNTTLFAFQHNRGSTFIGATPEFLYDRSGLSLSTEAVAGTKDKMDPQSRELLKNPKEFSEVKIVKDALVEKLSEYVTWNQNEASPHLISTSHLHHLRFTLKAALNQRLSDHALISLLHPTPAVNGYPVENALSFILKHEPFVRGYYASPLGRISDREAQIAVGIRSCLVEKDWVHLFSGAGIVEKSDPDQEWEELEMKIKQFKEWICP